MDIDAGNSGDNSMAEVTLKIKRHRLRANMYMDRYGFDMCTTNFSISFQDYNMERRAIRGLITTLLALEVIEC